jgi:hypothetical protein
MGIPICPYKYFLLGENSLSDEGNKDHCKQWHDLTSATANHGTCERQDSFLSISSDIKQSASGDAVQQTILQETRIGSFAAGHRMMNVRSYCWPNANMVVNNSILEFSAKNTKIMHAGIP